MATPKTYWDFINEGVVPKKKSVSTPNRVEYNGGDPSSSAWFTRKPIRQGVHINIPGAPASPTTPGPIFGGPGYPVPTPGPDVDGVNAGPNPGQVGSDAPPVVGTTGGGGGTGGGVTGTSFASRYTPAMLNQAYENPWYILRDIFSGLSESSPLYQALRDMGGDPLTLYNISQGANTKIGGGPEDFVNWLAGMYGEQGKVGGTGFDTKAMLNNLFGQTKFGADSENTLGQILGAGDMSTQIRTLYNMLRDTSNVGMNPLAARGYQSAVAQAGDRYGTAMMSQDAGAEGAKNPAQWLAENMPWLAG